MKTVFIISFLLVLGFHGVSAGDQNFQNLVTLNAAPDGLGDRGSDTVGDPITLYLVLLNPVDVENGDQPVSTIWGFECTLEFRGGYTFLLTESLPAGCTNSGDASDIFQGFLEYQISCEEPLVVIDHSVLLIQFLFMAMSPNGQEVLLTPTSSPSIPGKIAFQPSEGQHRVMYPHTIPNEDFVFHWVNYTPIEHRSFGSILALYR